MRIMKYLSILLSLAVYITTFTPVVGASEVENKSKRVTDLETINEYLLYKGKEKLEISDINNAANEAFEKANKTNEKNYEIIIPVKGDAETYGTVTLISKSENSIEKTSSIKLADYDQYESWNEEIVYQTKLPAPVNWSLQNSGDFSYGLNSDGLAVIKTVDADIDADATFPYKAYADEDINKIDAQGSVYEIEAIGTYEVNLPFGGVAYSGFLDVEINATGDVRVTRAEFDY